MSAFVGAALMASLGGCPANPVNPGVPGDLPPIEGNVGDPSGAGSDPNANDPTTASAPGGGDSLLVADADFATFQDQPVSLVLNGPVWSQANQAVDLNTASVAIVALPTAGTLEGPSVLEGNRIGFTYTPPAGFVGSVQFQYVARVANDESNVGLVTIRVYPDIQFDVQTSEDVNDLTGRAYALTVSGVALPDGTYIWTLDGVEDSGPMATHHERIYTFSPNQIHVLTLSVVLAGFSGPVACRSALDGTAEISMKIPPAITGTIVDANGQPMADVVISGNRIRDPAVSDAQGRYTVKVPRNWSGALRPAHPGATFQPPERYFSKVRRDLSGENFQGAAGFVTISGRVLDANGAALGDVLLSADNGGGSALTNAQGDYVLSLLRDWSGRVTPSAAGYTFSPAHRDYASLSGDLSQEDYGATAVPAGAFTISGRVLTSSGVPLADVLMSADNGGGSTTTNLQGDYALTLPSDWSGRITPSSGAYTFAPVFREYTLLGGDQTQQDYVASSVVAGNQPPVAFDQAVATHEDVAVNISLTASDPDNNPLEYVVLQLAAAGRLRDIGNGHVVVAGDLPYTLAASGAVLEYLPNADYNGADAFTFTAFDGTVLGNTATISVTVNAVNDAPSFDVPPSSGMAVGTPFVVNMTNVLSGPPDEAWQTVSFSARSSDQSVIPDGNLVFAGPRLTITAIAAGGPVTISVTGVDDGGTANGGVNSSGGGFQMTAVTGPVISGLISRVATLGANPPVGPVHLRFTGSGASTGIDFSVTSQVDGAYAAQVPSGWTGTVAAADPIRAYFTPLSRVYSSPVTAPQLNQDYSAWTAPIGIPGPEFGIREATPGYDPNNPLHYYIDNTHPNATNNANPNGSPSRPRLTLPYLQSLSPGTLVYINAGTYTPGDVRVWHTHGTAANPVFISGNPASRPIVSAYWDISDSSYVILENLEMDGRVFAGTMFEINPHRGPLHHISVRNNEIHHKPHRARAALTIGGGNVPLGTASHVVAYNNSIHDIGDWLTTEDPNDAGVLISKPSDHLWILDNEISYTSADAMGINGGYVNGQYTTHHVYFGRNVVHHNRQGGGLVKMGEHVIFSQNVAFGHHNPVFGGHGLGTDRSPHNAWFIFNRLYDNNEGISMHGEEPPAPPGGTIYVIGNLIYNSHSPSFNPENPWGSAAIHARRNHFQRYIIGNTIYDVDGGIYSHSGGSWFIHNNIIANVRSDAYHIFLDDERLNTTWNLGNSLLAQESGSIRIRWQNYVFTSLPALLSQLGQGAGCLEADPRFWDPARSDFHLLPDSPVVDAGVVESVYATFSALYGLSIAVDQEGRSRPLDGDGNGSAEWDMGALEYQRP